MKRSELRSRKKKFLLYETLVQPVLLYGEDHWGLKVRPEIGRVRRYMEIAMAVDRNTPGCIWRMELGQMATSTIAKKRVLEYVLGIRSMEGKR